MAITIEQIVAYNYKSIQLAFSIFLFIAHLIEILHLK